MFYKSHKCNHKQVTVFTTHASMSYFDDCGCERISNFDFRFFKK